MPGTARLSDIHIGICDHGASCCPHNVVGIIVAGAGSVLTNGLPTARISDPVTHNCPHCGTGICSTGSGNVFAEGLPHHRLGDIVVYPAGVGTTVTASGNVITN
jgi:uncharacterized Zn-binding protein involved in type VI secretion